VWPSELHNFGLAIHQGYEIQRIFDNVSLWRQVNTFNCVNALVCFKSGYIEGKKLDSRPKSPKESSVGLVRKQYKVNVEGKQRLHPFNPLFDRNSVIRRIDDIGYVRYIAGHSCSFL
jgi:hypothetical protein